MQAPAGPILSDWISTAENLRLEVLGIIFGKVKSGVKANLPIGLGGDYTWTAVSYDSWGEDYADAYKTDLSLLYKEDCFDGNKINPKTGRSHEHLIVMELLVSSVFRRHSPCGYGELADPATQNLPREQKLKILELAHACSVVQCLRWPLKSTIAANRQKRKDMTTSFVARVGQIGNWFKDQVPPSTASEYERAPYTSSLIEAALEILRKEFSVENLLDAMTEKIGDDEQDQSDQRDEKSISFIEKRQLLVSGDVSQAILTNARTLALPDQIQQLDVFILLATEANAGTGFWQRHSELVPNEALRELFHKEGHHQVRTFKRSTIAPNEESSNYCHIPYGHFEPVPFGLILLRVKRNIAYNLYGNREPQGVSDLCFTKFGFRRCADVDLVRWNPHCREYGPTTPFNLWCRLLKEKEAKTQESLKKDGKKGKKNKWFSSDMSDEDKKNYSYLRHYASVERYFLRVTLAAAAESPVVTDSGMCSGGGTLQGVPNEVREHIMTFVLGEFSMPSDFLRKTFKFPSSSLVSRD